MNIREFRRNDLAAIARVNVDAFKVTHRGIVSDGFMEELSYPKAEQRFERMLLKKERQSFIYVVEIDTDIVGYAMAGLAREAVGGHEGELYGIYILPEHHGVGIGRQLVRRCVERLQMAGVKSMFVWVVTANTPGRKFYEAIGGRKIEQRQISLGGGLVGETAYGWSDLAESFDQ